MPAPVAAPAPDDDVLDSAQLLRLIFDHASEGITVFDARLRLQAWNPQFLTLTQIDPAHDRRVEPALPAAPESPEAPAAPALPLPLPAAPPRQHTVLYIEDNEVNQLLMEGMLAQRPGIKLLMAELPLPGLALATQERPDLVLLDIQLPGIDGFEVLKRLRAGAATRAIPVVAVSANAMPADREKATRAGFVDYITKPIDLPVLLATVDRLLAG